MKVLLVDDSRVFLEQTVSLFARLDFQCSISTCGTGQEALDIVEKWKPDIILLDLILPDIDGLEVLRQVKANHNDIFVLMLTGWKDSESLKTAFSLGVYDYLTKPVEVVEFSLRVGSAVKAKQEETRRKRAEQELLKSEATLNSILESLEDVVFRMSSEGYRFEYLNPKVESLLGYSPEELLNEEINLLDLIHPDDKQKFLDSLQPVSGHQCSDVEFRMFRPDGDVRWVRVRSSVRFSLYDKSPVITGIIRDITSRKNLEEKLTRLSLYDELTGLFNRNYFKAETERLRGKRNGTIGIILCDVDGLKLINDTLGHEAGDDCLRLTANTIKKGFREGDVIARIGGDEFALLVENADEEILKLICSRITSAVEEVNACNTGLPLSISVGYSLMDKEYMSIDDAIKEADDRMYREKLVRSLEQRNTINSLSRNIEASFGRKLPMNTKRLEDLAFSMGDCLGLPQNTIANVLVLARSHNIGYISVPRGILLKPGELTRAEYKEVQRHCEVGMRLASHSPNLAVVADWILKHHERWDGKGYPLNLKGENIPVECRLFALIDAFNAMISDRPYRKAMTTKQAVEELKRAAGSQFDPAMVKVFIENCAG